MRPYLRTLFVLLSITHAVAIDNLADERQVDRGIHVLAPLPEMTPREQFEERQGIKQQVFCHAQCAGIVFLGYATYLMGDLYSQYTNTYDLPQFIKYAGLSMVAIGSIMYQYKDYPRITEPQKQIHKHSLLLRLAGTSILMNTSLNADNVLRTSNFVTHQVNLMVLLSALYSTLRLSCNYYYQ